MTRRNSPHVHLLFIWLALALTAMAAGDVVEDLIVEAAEVESRASTSLPEVENPVENTLVPSQKPDHGSPARHHAGSSNPAVVTVAAGGPLVGSPAIGRADRPPPYLLIPHPQPSLLPLRL